MILDLTNEYVAGLFDGEGWIMISRSRPSLKFKQKTSPYHLRIGIEMTCKDILEKIQQKYGGSLYIRPKPRAVDRKVCFIWYLDSDKAMEFLKKIKSFLFVKRKQAEIAIEYQEHIEKFKKENSGFRHYGIPLKEVDFREKIVQKIRSLNSFNNLRK